MMNIHIAESNLGLGASQSFTFSCTAQEIDAVSDTYSFEGPIVIEGTVTRTGTSFRVKGTIEARKHFVCDRCLADSFEDQVHPFEEEFYRPGEVAEETSNIVDGDELDIQELVRDTLLAAQPLSNICKPDCKGLCPVCGHNLNEGDCGCDRFVPDPRMAALQQLLKKTK